MIDKLIQFISVLFTFIKELRLRPTYQVKGNLSRLSLDRLQEDGVKGLILDLDNTLMIPSSAILMTEIAEWLKDAQARDIRLIILTNNTKHKYLDHVESIFKNINISMIRVGMKPLPQKIKQCISLLHLYPGEICIVGDRVFTDVLGGIHAKVPSVLVAPLIGSDEVWYKVIGRKIEYACLGKPHKWI